jgi:hypothetical protein
MLKRKNLAIYFELYSIMVHTSYRDDKGTPSERMGRKTKEPNPEGI